MKPACDNELAETFFSETGAVAHEQVASFDRPAVAKEHVQRCDWPGGGLISDAINARCNEPRDRVQIGARDQCKPVWPKDAYKFAQCAVNLVVVKVFDIV